MLLDELAALRQELARTRNEKDALLNTLAVSDAPNAFDPIRCSTVRDESTGNVEGTLIASVNNMSLSTMNITECKPTEGEAEIDKKGYAYWQNILVASLNLIQATDENTKMDVFRIKAGPQLLELLQGIKSTTEMPDENMCPFSNALARLDGYFGSRAYMLSQRSKLLNTAQQVGESNTQFVRRVAASAKLCGYDKEDDEMEAVARTMIKSSNDKRVRTLAHRNWIKHGSLNDLIDLVRDYETEISNEEESQKIQKSQGSVSIAAISSNTEDRGIFRNTLGKFNRNRGRGSYQRVATYAREQPGKT
ncbi:uncharacterized protein LOC131683008 isoform X3 [Topomyia yanbarensis]|uniref:uncharacterized protein LOC131683008 isoform X3 n=1 Tax=Topomyia yanbarensis TaxID=2498891 RepID=UPI00273C28BA|nr:uncharacterized protein LOC131683008 isoform X3 [Topomyia yanbarensis]